MIFVKSGQLKKVVKWAVTCVLVGLLIATIEWRDVWVALTRVRVGYVGAFVALYVIGIGISARKWHDIAAIVGFRHRFAFYCRAYIVGIFINHFLPSFIGGDTYRTYALGRPSRRMADAAATVVWDRVSGLMALVVMAAAGMLFFGGAILREHALLQMMTAGLIAVMATVVVGGVVARRVGIVRVTAIVPSRVGHLLRSLYRMFTPRAFAVASLWSVVFSVVGVACANMALFYAFDVRIAPRDYLSVIFLTNIVAALPISVGNIGIKEWAYIFLFGLFGVDSGVAVAIVMLSRVAQMVVSTAALPMYARVRDGVRAAS